MEEKSKNQKPLQLNIKMRAMNTNYVILFQPCFILVVLLFIFNPFCSGQNTFTKNPLHLRGQISAGGFIYSQTGGIDRQAPRGYSLNAQFNASIYGIQIPIFASINEQGSRFENPFNRFGLSPRYKWARLHLGWRFMQFSQFTLSGVNFLGAGIELTPGKWRLAAMSGRFQEETDGSNDNYPHPRYRRNGWAAKIGYGTSRNFIDLICFKAKDDLNSMQFPDSVNVAAHENLSLGLRSELSIIPNYLSIYVDGGISAFTENLRSDSIPAEARRYVEAFSGLYEPNISSHLNYALVGGARIHLPHSKIRLEYRRIMPEYRSLGINYLLNDVEAITINPSLHLFSQKMIISGSLGLQRNNIDNLRQNQNQRNIGSIQLQINPHPTYGISAQYSNYSFAQQLVRDTLFGDSLVLDQVNQNIVLTPRFIIKHRGHTHSIVTNYNFQKLTDRIKREGIDHENEMHLINFNYSWFNKKTGTQLRAGSNFFLFQSEANNIKRLGWTFGVRQTIFKKKVNLQTNTGFQHSLDSKDVSMYIGIQCSWIIYKNLSLHLNSRVRLSERNQIKQRESRSEIRIMQRF